MISFNKEETKQVSVDSRQIVTFESGLIGLPQLKVFALIEDELSLPIRLLQCISVPQFVFVVINPFTVYPNYDIEISDEARLVSIHCDLFCSLGIVHGVVFGLGLTRQDSKSRELILDFLIGDEDSFFVLGKRSAVVCLGLIHIGANPPAVKYWRQCRGSQRGYEILPIEDAAGIGTFKPGESSER